MFRFFFFFFFSVSFLFAQTPTLLASTIDEDNTKPKPVAIERVAVEVVIRGFLAETKMTLTFRNNLDNDLEGELLFPLPEGTTLSGYALDIEGNLVDGVIVEKNKARLIFEKEKRKRIDPGLAEWVQGNHFRTRVYPIPARGCRIVRVSYISKLVKVEQELKYLLPLHFPHTLPQFSLKIEAIAGYGIPTFYERSSSILFSETGDHFSFENNRTNETVVEDFSVTLPAVPSSIVEIESDSKNEAYFAIYDTPEIPKTMTPINPKRIGLYWDASFSQNETDKTKCYEMLSLLCQRWQDLIIDLIVFRNKTEAPKTFQIRHGQSEELLRFLKQIPYDGGTDLSTLTFLATSLELTAKYDFYLLFTDGFSNMEKISLDKAQVPIYSIATEGKSNHYLLRALAGSSGGNHFNLSLQSKEQAASEIGIPPFLFLGAKYNPKQIESISPNVCQPVSSSFEITGRLLSSEATLVLQYGYLNHVVYETTLQLQRKDQTQTKLVPRFWAQKKVMELSLSEKENGQELFSLGKRFGLVTPNTSLLVLENIEQYLEYDVEPPESLPTIREEWIQRKEEIAQEKKETPHKMEKVVSDWEKRVKWWNSDFSHWSPRNFNEEENSGMIGSASFGMGATFSDESSEENENSMVLQLEPWDPKTPYIGTIKEAAKQNRAYQTYLDQREGFYKNNSSYYFDCANYFFRQGNKEIGLRILSTILDLKLESPELLRMLAYRLEQENEIKLAILFLENILSLRTEEPQSYRDLALALARRAEQNWEKDIKSAISDLEKAMHLLYHIIVYEWDERFTGIENIVLMELNRIWSKAEQLENKSKVQIKKPNLDSRLRQLLDVDVRITLSWDSDLTDLDLWIIEPTQQKCYYENPLSEIGGHLSADFTGGYGPEEYCLHQLVPGTYQIKIHYYGDHDSSSESEEENRLGAPVTMKVVVFTNYGRENEQRQEMVMRLDEVDQSNLVGAIPLFQIKKDPENIVSQHITGTWQRDLPLTQRIGANEDTPDILMNAQELTFVEDASVLQSIPEKAKLLLIKKDIYFVGKIRHATQEFPFLLTQQNGNPQIMYFVENADKTETNFYFLNGMFVVAKEQKQNLLFLGKQGSFVPFSRKQ